MYRKIRDYVLYQGVRDRQLRRQAQLACDWIFGVGEGAKIYEGTILSFEDVCEILDLPSPEEMRAKIRLLRKDDLLRRVKACEQATVLEARRQDAGDDADDS